MPTSVFTLRLALAIVSFCALSAMHAIAEVPTADRAPLDIRPPIAKVQDRKTSEKPTPAKLAKATKPLSGVGHKSLMPRGKSGRETPAAKVIAAAVSPVTGASKSSLPTASVEKPSNVEAPAIPPKDAGKSGDANTVAALTHDASGAARAFCTAVSDEIGQTRLAWQMSKLTELENALRTRIAELEVKRGELQKLVDKQDEQNKKMEDSVVAIFSRMRPESAASQLSIMEDATAATVLSKLNPRIASSILNEIVPVKAARIADAMSGVSSVARN